MTSILNIFKSYWLNSKKYIPSLIQAHRELTKGSMFFSLVLLIILFGCLYSQVLDINVWRHDAAIYLISYLGKLQEEGRWINYYLFPIFKEIPPQIAIAICLICLFYISYTLAWRYSKQRTLSLLFALAVLQIQAFYSIIGWPNTVLPAFVFLAFFVWLSAYVPYFVIFILGGIVFFGTFNNFYNILPLLFLNKVKNFNYKELFNFIVTWVLCFCFGYIIMLIVLKIVTGQNSLSVADWRLPNPIHSIEDLFKNTNRVVQDLKYHINLSGRSIFYLSLIAVLVDLFQTSKQKIDGIRNITTGKVFLYVIVISVSLSCYIQSIPMGLGVGARTAFPLFLSILFICLVIYKNYNIFSVVLLLGFSLFSFWNNYQSIVFYTSITNNFLSEVKKIDSSPSTTALVIFCMSDQDVARVESAFYRNLHLKNIHNEGFGARMRIQPAFWSAGYRNFVWDIASCPLDKEKTTSVFSYTIKNGNLYIWIREDFK